MYVDNPNASSAATILPPETNAVPDETRRLDLVLTNLSTVALIAVPLLCSAIVVGRYVFRSSLRPLPGAKADHPSDAD